MFQGIASFTVNSLGLTGNIASAVEFWIYDTLKIVFIMSLVISAVSFLRTYFSPGKIRDYLQNRGKITGYILASFFGIISPFCSCSTIPLFLGMVGAGVPFGMVITFLFVSPMVNEAAIVVLFTNLGWKIALFYLLGGVTVGITGGLTLKKLGFEKYVVDFKYGKQNNNNSDLNFTDRVTQSFKEAKEIILDILPYVIIGVGIGALIHGFLPTTFIEGILQGTFAVPLAVLVGVPIYTNVMGAIPVAESLINKGLEVGTAMAFLMAVAALSLPQFIMLNRVLKKKLLIAYGSIITLGIIIIGYLFNFFL